MSKFTNPVVRNHVHYMYQFSSSGKVHYLVNSFHFVLSRKELIQHVLFREPYITSIVPEYVLKKANYEALADLLRIIMNDSLESDLLSFTSKL